MFSSGVGTVFLLGLIVTSLFDILIVGFVSVLSDFRATQDSWTEGL